MKAYKRVKPALGTLFEITLQKISQEEALNFSSQAFEEVYRLEKIFNIFDSASELANINRRPPLQKCLISPEMEKVLAFGKIIEDQSAGSFRLMPDQIQAYVLGDGFVTRFNNAKFDLNGIAKGFVVDSIFEYLETRAPRAEILVNAGGDLRCNFPQNIELRVSSLESEKRFKIKSHTGSMATSSLLGQNLNVGVGAAHFKSVAEAQVSSQPKTVSVFAKSCMAADGATKAFLFGDLKFPADFGISSWLKFDSLGQLA